MSDESPDKKARGRPKKQDNPADEGSANRKRKANELSGDSGAKRGRGRPKGSTGKKKRRKGRVGGKKRTKKSKGITSF